MVTGPGGDRLSSDFPSVSVSLYVSLSLSLRLSVSLRRDRAARRLGRDMHGRAFPAIRDSTAVAEFRVVLSGGLFPSL